MIVLAARSLSERIVVGVLGADSRAFRDKKPAASSAMVLAISTAPTAASENEEIFRIQARLGLPAI